LEAQFTSSDLLCRRTSRVHQNSPARLLQVVCLQIQSGIAYDNISTSHSFIQSIHIHLSCAASVLLRKWKKKRYFAFRTPQTVNALTSPTLGYILIMCLIRGIVFKPRICWTSPIIQVNRSQTNILYSY